MRRHCARLDHRLIIEACYELSIETASRCKNFRPSAALRRRRTTLGNSHGIQLTVHGRMPSGLTGRHLRNRDLIYSGVSGDGDVRRRFRLATGQFEH